MRNTAIATADLSSRVQISALHLNDWAIDSTTWRINGTNMYPIHLTILYHDGTRQVLSRPVGIWADGRKTVLFALKGIRQVDKISLGSAYDADVQPKNNNWTHPAKTGTLTKNRLVTRLVRRIDSFVLS